MRRFLKVRRAGSNPHRSPRLPMTLRNLGENQSLWTGPPFPTITELIRSFGEVVKQSFACCQLAGALHTDAAWCKVSLSWQAKTEVPERKFNRKKGVGDENNAGLLAFLFAFSAAAPDVASAQGAVSAAKQLPATYVSAADIQANLNGAPNE